ncbi:MAG: serine hydroxymethyltransferase [archaeon]
MSFVEKTDPEVYKAIKNETTRQNEGLEMIPSENFVSKAVLEALGSVFTNKYSEGYSHKRYYGGNENVDVIEDLAIARAKKLFGVEHVNVQPLSGSPANFAVYMATCKPGDTIMGLNLSDGGHITHGLKVNASAIFYKSVPYHVKPDGYFDLEGFRKLAIEHKPKLIWCGITAYPRLVPFDEFAKVADEVGAYLAADIAHISGLVATGVHPDPVPHVHIVTTTTHKTLRGPRGGMIMVTKKGLEKDPDLAKKVDKAIFPGLQGGPHDHQIAALAVTLKEAMDPSFIDYSKRIVANCKALAASMMESGLKLVTDGTDNHMVLLDLTPSGKGRGLYAQEALELAGITVNKNTIPADPASPFYPSGVRLGTPALTTRGMKEPEMKVIGEWIASVVKEIEGFEMPDDKEKRKDAISDFREKIKDNKELPRIREEVRVLCNRFPLYD